MRLYIVASLGLVSGLCSLVFAQTATGPGAGITITRNAQTDEVFVRWWAKDAHYYFLTSTTDLIADPWAYFPYAVIGDDSVKGIAVTPSTANIFFRVEFTNDPQAPLLLQDFDGDSVNGADELNLGGNPFISINSDTDNLHDDFEILLGSDPLVANTVIPEGLGQILLNVWATLR